jgi:HSP20 family protein
MATTQVTRKQSGDEMARCEPTRNGVWYRPNVDIIERPDELLIRADMPGASMNEIDVRFENGALSIHAHVPNRQSTNVNYLWREFGVGDFHRSFEVSEMIDAANITAEYRDGVLSLHLPKVERARPRRITVKTA